RSRVADNCPTGVAHSGLPVGGGSRRLAAASKLLVVTLPGGSADPVMAMATAANPAATPRPTSPTDSHRYRVRGIMPPPRQRLCEQPRIITRDESGATHPRLPRLRAGPDHEFPKSPEVFGVMRQRRPSIVVVAMRGEDHGTGRLVEDQLARPVVVAPVEVEHVVERPGDRVERAARLDAFSEQPVVFDEAQDRGLVDQGVVDMIS